MPPLPPFDRRKKQVGRKATPPRPKTLTLPKHGNDGARTTSSGAHDEPDPSRVPQPNPLAASSPGGGGARRQSPTTTTTTTTTAAKGDGHSLPFVKPSSYLRRKPMTSGRRTMAEQPAPSPLDREQMQGLVSAAIFVLFVLSGKGGWSSGLSPPPLCLHHTIPSSSARHCPQCAARVRRSAPLLRLGSPSMTPLCLAVPSDLSRVQRPGEPRDPALASPCRRHRPCSPSEVQR